MCTKSNCYFSMAPTRRCMTGKAKRLSTLRRTTLFVQNSRSIDCYLLVVRTADDLKACQILRNSVEIGGLRGIQKVRHSRIVGARTTAEIGHRLEQILALLAGNTRRGSVALKLLKVARR